MCSQTPGTLTELRQHLHRRAPQNRSPESPELFYLDRTGGRKLRIHKSHLSTDGLIIEQAASGQCRRGGDMAEVMLDP